MERDEEIIVFEEEKIEKEMESLEERGKEYGVMVDEERKYSGIVRRDEMEEGKRIKDFEEIEEDEKI